MSKTAKNRYTLWVVSSCLQTFSLYHNIKHFFINIVNIEKV
ncbi:hypothetical protein [Helicobacter pylori]|nr:hypothetical protein [Helicobacter pylori]